jgi:hypothetical protein
MSLIKQLVRRELDEAAIARKKKKIQAVINASPTIKKAVDERVGAKRPKSEEDLEKARISAIRQIMRTKLSFAKQVADAAKS